MTDSNWDAENRQTILQLARAGLTAGHSLSLRVTSQSMAPLLKPGDVVIVHPARTETLIRGDLVVFHQDGELVTHRLITLTNQRMLTKGDNSPRFDSWVPITHLVGRVITLHHGEEQTDFRKATWIHINRLFGWVGWLEGSIYAYGKRLRKPLIPALSFLHMGTLSRIFSFPFTVLRKVLTGISRSIV